MTHASKNEQTVKRTADPLIPAEATSEIFDTGLLEVASAEGALVLDNPSAALAARNRGGRDTSPPALKPKRRGTFVGRMLIVSDAAALASAFLAAALLLSGPDAFGNPPDARILLFLMTLPGWMGVAELYGLYKQDQRRTEHTTTDDFVGILHMVTIGTLLGGLFFLFAARVLDLPDPKVSELLTFWALAIPLVLFGRACTRAIARRHSAYVQNAVVVGAGEVGQRIARKLLQHPEYGIKVIGLVDGSPMERRADVGELPILGSPASLPSVIRRFDVERVIVAFSLERHEEMLDLIRSLKDFPVQIDIVPRFFEIVGPRARFSTLEAVPLIGLPAADFTRVSLAIKRAIDILGAATLLFLTAPLFGYIAWRIRRESPGPVFFRQTRLGREMREFTILKFRTMRTNADHTAHREYIEKTMAGVEATNGNGLFKLDRDDVITPFGSRLRSTSLDELPQLINVLRGEMSLVGPRPCIPYETKQFEPHHSERFLVRPGLTGFWQVKARAQCTFREALEMDVLYVRNWTISLDLWLLCRTPARVLTRSGTA